MGKRVVIYPPFYQIFFFIFTFIFVATTESQGKEKQEKAHSNSGFHLLVKLSSWLPRSSAMQNYSQFMVAYVCLCVPKCGVLMCAYTWETLEGKVSKVLVFSDR